MGVCQGSQPIFIPLQGFGGLLILKRLWYAPMLCMRCTGYSDLRTFNLEQQRGEKKSPRGGPGCEWIDWAAGLVLLPPVCSAWRWIRGGTLCFRTRFQGVEPARSGYKDGKGAAHVRELLKPPWHSSVPLRHYEVLRNRQASHSSVKREPSFRSGYSRRLFPGPTRHIFQSPSSRLGHPRKCRVPCQRGRAGWLSVCGCEKGSCTANKCPFFNLACCLRASLGERLACFRGVSS